MTARQQTCRAALQLVMIASHGIPAQVREGVPALATADIGIAISAGSDGAKQAGDLLLVGNDPGAVVAAIGLSGATIRKICQNLFRAVVHNSLGVPIAALGWLNPRIAAAGLALSSLSVIVNCSLLRRHRVRQLTIATF